MSATPPKSTPLHGLRTWTVVGEEGAERLAGPQLHETWPAAGAWLEAACALSPEHRPPARGCVCGIHAWHPSRRAARRILAGSEVAGIAEAGGAIELDEHGLRGQRARPYALVVAPGRNSRLVRRLAEAYEAEVVEVDGADALLAFCRTRGLGLDEAEVARLLGPATADARRLARQRKVRADALRVVAAVVVAALLMMAGQLVTDPPGDRVLYGRTGEVIPHSR